MSNIIVVDDDPTNITLTKLLLELDGYSVTTCFDITSAKASAGDGTDAFLIDCNLARGANGIDLLRDIRSGTTGAEEEVVVIITSGDYRREVEASEAGADMFLLKPYPPESLSDNLAKLLKMKKGKHVE